MIPLQKNYSVSAVDITELLKTHDTRLLQAFYESQSSFLCGVNKRYHSIETGNIILCFARNMHLEIIRQREKDLNFNVSLENFWKNFNEIYKPSSKITSIVKITGIPKETVRRKVKNLVKLGFLTNDKKNKGYYWSLLPKEKDAYFKIINYETKNLAKFFSKIVNSLKINLDNKIVENEIRSQFSFYWYHYLSCQLKWLKMWQLKLKDNVMLLVALQATTPALQFIEKNKNKKTKSDAFKIIEKDKENTQDQHFEINATSISEVTGIPRATCIRKLDKLVNLGYLMHSVRTKKYSVNLSMEGRAKDILGIYSIGFTIKTFSEYIAIILNSLIHNRL